MKRRWVVTTIFMVFLVCAFAIKLSPTGLLPESAEKWDRTFDFFKAAFTPAFDYLDENVPDDAPNIWLKGLNGVFLTLKFACGSMSLAIPAALVLGFFGSSVWWPQPCPPLLRRLLQALFISSRMFMSFCRSIHELIWALLLLSAFGVSPLAGMLAIAIPFSGTLGKVFSELFEEESLKAAQALKATGHRSIQTFLVAIVPGALPNLLTYSFYRFECALRSSAVLGFVGIETIGLYIDRSHEELYYTEIWTYLYLLLALILAVDFWGAKIRKHLNPSLEKYSHA